MLKVIFMTALFMFATLPANAMQPQVTPIDIGADKGKQFTCSGHVYSFTESLNAAQECNGASPCAHVMIEDCAIWQDVKALYCNGVAYDKAEITRITAMPLINSSGDSDVLIQLEKEGIHQKDAGFLEIYQKRMAEKVAKKPAVTVSGTLENCTSCPECGPSKTCVLSSCSIDFLK